MEQPKDHFISVHTIWTRYWDLGAGSPVLLLHGLGASAETWQHVVGPLAEHHRVLVPDLVGFGFTEKPDIDYTLEAFVGFVGAFMEALSVRRADIVGHSFGGLIALRIAIEHPEWVTRLVISDAAGIGEGSNPFLQLLLIPGVGELLLRPNRRKTREALKMYFHDPSNVTEAWVDLNYTLITQPGAQRAYLSTVRNTNSFSGASREVRAHVAEQLHQIEAPTLVLWGEEDRILSPEIAHIAANRIPNSRLQLIPAAGHNPMVEQPTRFSDALLDFLSYSG